MRSRPSTLWALLAVPVLLGLVWVATGLLVRAPAPHLGTSVTVTPTGAATLTPSGPTGGPTTPPDPSTGVATTTGAVPVQPTTLCPAGTPDPDDVEDDLDDDDDADDWCDD